jgi:hypothetical protein
MHRSDGVARDQIFSRSRPGPPALPEQFGSAKATFWPIAKTSVNQWAFGQTT